jgi:hypothetical protein
MAVLVLLIGLLLIVTGIRGTTRAAGAAIANDLGAYWPMLVAILAIGSIGMVKEFQALSRALMFLVIIVIVLRERGLFDQLKNLPTAVRGVYNVQPAEPLKEPLGSAPIKIEGGQQGGSAGSAPGAALGGPAGAIGGIMRMFTR